MSRIPIQSETAIRLDHIKKNYYGTFRQEVFTDISFEVKKGEFVAVSGPIGSGKTTLINLISGTDRPEAGSIRIEGIETTSLNDNALARLRSSKMGIVYQTHDLIPHLTVYENVELPLVLNNINKEERSSKVNHTLEIMRISGEGNRRVDTLSVGEGQLVATARALVNDPPIILMDEPTESLDPIVSEMVLGLLRGENMLKGKALLIATHDRKIMNLAQRVIRIKKRIL